tara:strand:- start:43 stop:894 length:852 start_codon:yes stop_codon:yes gene_type:complete
MFGPNQHLEYLVNVKESHRDSSFCYKYLKTVDKFKEKFHLQDYDILFIGGGGTIGIESIFFSCKNKIEVIGREGVFKDRWQKLSELYCKKSNKKTNLFCQLETSNSQTFHQENCYVDAISSFPYYDIPNSSKVFATCSNKQLGSLIGLSIVAVKKDCWSDFIDEHTFSYLNLSRYKFFQKSNQTPSTTPTYIFEHLLCKLKNFDVDRLRETVDDNCKKIRSKISEENIIGESNCPVITIKKSSIKKELAEKYQIYGINNNSKYYQIFTYNNEPEALQDMIRSL